MKLDMCLEAYFSWNDDEKMLCGAISNRKGDDLNCAADGFCFRKVCLKYWQLQYEGACKYLGSIIYGVLRVCHPKKRSNIDFQGRG